MAEAVAKAARAGHYQRLGCGAALLLHRDARRPADGTALTFVREPRKMPVVLSPEESARLLEAAPGPKYKAALSAAYAAGLRVSEVVALKVSMSIPAPAAADQQGKGRKDRFAMLSPKLLELCATGIASPGRRCGCSPAAIGCCR